MTETSAAGLKGQKDKKNQKNYESDSYPCVLTVYEAGDRS